MPRSYGKSKKSRRSAYRSRKRTKNNKSRPLPLGGVGTSHLVKLRYCQTVTLDAGAGTLSVNAFRANSLYDPDSTGVGHQPSNFDRWAAMFDRYTVIGSKCTVYPVYVSTSNANPATLCLALSEDGTVISTAHASGGIENIIEQPRLKVSLKNLGLTNSFGDGILTKYFSAKKFFGVRNLIGESPYSAGITANPTEGAFFEVACVSPDDSADPGSFKVRVVIDYIAMMTEPKIADTS